MAMIRDLINQLTNNKVVYADVIDVCRGQASIKLVGSDSRLSNLDVVGGTVVAGDRVVILWDGKRPYVHIGTNVESAVSTVASASPTPEGALEELYLQEDAASAIKQYDVAGTEIAKFPITSAGFDDALLAAASGDIIIIPPATITGDHTIGDGIKVVGLSRYATILSGEITGGDGASIENLSVIRSDNSADTLVGVGSPSTGTFYINDCDVEVTQAGSGDAYGLSADADSTLIEAWNSFFSGDSGSGSGYGVYRDTGTSASANIYGGRVYGTTGSMSE